MNLAVRRRLAVGALATSTALVVGLVVAPPALAGNVTSVSPSFAYNDDDTEILTFTTQSDFTPDPLAGGAVTATLIRSGTTDSFDGSPVAYTDPNHPKAEFNFKDTGSGDNDGPANPGFYDVKIEDAFNGTTDTCQRCFQVFTAGTLGVSSATPSSLAAGGSADVTFTGAGFARGTKVELLLPGTSTVDTAVTVGAPTTAGTPQQCIPQGTPTCTVPDPNRTTNTTLKRKISIATSDLAGKRDVRVTNVDGTTATCSGCFTVNGAPLTSVNPSVADNSPSAATGTVRITFSGTNVPQGGTPSLVFIGNAGSSTKEALTLKGTNATFTTNSVSADFDVRSAAPGVDAYVPTVTAADGSTNTCSCRFSVGQASPPAVTSLSPNSMPQSDSRTVTINGNNFSRGVKITVSGTGVDVTSVQFVSSTQVRATFQVQGNAAAGKRDVTASTTSGPTGDPSYPKTGPACAGCFTVTAAASPSPSGSPPAQGCKTLTVTVNTPTINATGRASVTISGATSTATIELQGYSQNHYGTANFDNDITKVDRSGQADSNGKITFSDLKPASNTRLRARQAGCTYDSNTPVIEVRAQETLNVQRVGTRKYTFSGRSIPARPGGLIVSLYRIVGSACAAGVEPSQCPGEKFVGQNRAAPLGASNEGLYSITITFPSSDSNVRDEFVVKTGRDAQNAPGRSNARSLLIY